jgi:hypothetical protein
MHDNENEKIRPVRVSPIGEGLDKSSPGGIFESRLARHLKSRLAISCPVTRFRRRSMRKIFRPALHDP